MINNKSHLKLFLNKLLIGMEVLVFSNCLIPPCSILLRFLFKNPPYTLLPNN